MGGRRCGSGVCHHSWALRSTAERLAASLFLDELLGVSESLIALQHDVFRSLDPVAEGRLEYPYYDESNYNQANNGDKDVDHESDLAYSLPYICCT
jgi:hypothetical protein